MAKVPSSAGSKLVRDFVDRLLVANKQLRFTETPLVRATPGSPAKLKPDVVYTAGKPGATAVSGKPIKYVYTTDSAGRVATAHGRPLQLPAQKVKRASHYRNPPGKLDGDHAGHLFADMFGGAPGMENVVAQLRDVNGSQMARLERDWKQRLSKTPPDVIEVDITIQYDASGTRPAGFNVFEFVNGKRTKVGSFQN